MVLTKTIDVKIASSNINYYINLGYSVKLDQTISIPYIDLPKKSNINIDIKCDICGVVKKSSNNAYNRYLQRSPDFKYRCNKCNIGLKKSTNLIKYGDKNYTNRTKYKKTLNEKYGGHFNKLKEFKDKIKKTCIEKYGDEHPMKNKSIKDIQQNTIKEKFGTNCSLQNPSVLEKTIKTMNEKYGVSYSMQSKFISDKINISSKKTKIKKIIDKNSNIIKIDYDKNLYYVICESCLNEFKITPHMFTMRSLTNSKICTICNKVDRHTSGIEISFIDEIKKIYNGGS